MSFIKLDNLSYTYFGSNKPALTEISLDIQEGDFVALVGHNGSGKSTLARLFNGLLLPTSGEVVVGGLNTKTSKNLIEIRKTVGLVFQNPDNQTVATVVEDDVAFGPENIGVPRAEIRERVDWALGAVDMLEYARSTHTRLSGGQKQRIAIAAVLALRPQVIVLDESTSMLDPRGRREVLSVILRLNREHRTTVVMITHFMDEALLADRTVVLKEGKIILDGGVEIYQERQRIESAGLQLPMFCQVAARLQHMGYDIGTVSSQKQLVEAIVGSGRWTVSKGQVCGSRDFVCENTIDGEQPAFNSTVDQQQDRLESESNANITEPSDGQAQRVLSTESEGKANSTVVDDGQTQRVLPAVSASELYFVYSPKSSFRKIALDGVSIQITEGDFVGIVGQTGSGKSTFALHLNALIKLQKGQLQVCGMDLSRKFKYKDLRSQVGMVFQYPEYQLFDSTVASDIGFGPKNIGLDSAEIDRRVRESMRLVGLDYQALAQKSPFEISGGQKRRVALAGVIAMRPKVLVLDEPTAGLDPKGKQEILDLIQSIRDFCPTIIMISHNMDEIAAYADKVALFNNGKLLQYATTREIFLQTELLHDLSLDVPSTVKIASKLRERGLNIKRDCLTIEELMAQLRERRSG